MHLCCSENNKGAHIPVPTSLHRSALALTTLLFATISNKEVPQSQLAEEIQIHKQEQQAGD